MAAAQSLLGPVGCRSPHRHVPVPTAHGKLNHPTAAVFGEYQAPEGFRIAVGVAVKGTNMLEQRDLERPGSEEQAYQKSGSKARGHAIFDRPHRQHILLNYV